jgi:hypothetical protein
MNKTRALRLTALLLVSCAGGEAVGITLPVGTPPAPPPAAVADNPEKGAAAAQPQATPAPLQIVDLLDASPGIKASGHAGLNHNLWVVLSRKPDVPADRYSLVLNGNKLKGIGPAIDVPFESPDHQPTAALAFKLRRVSDDDAFWRDLLGAPKASTVSVAVSLEQSGDPCGPSAHDCKTAPVTIAGDAAHTTFELVIFTPARLAVALLAIAIAVFLVWGHARSRTTLRDDLLPQLAPSQQTYSLARWQMAFWFNLIFASFVFLFILLWDYNTISSQALILMGISGATALAAVAVDVVKDSPADAVNRGLQALGLNSYDDVLRLRQDIADRETEVATNPPPERLAQLQSEIQDRRNILRTYQDKTRRFVSQGWFQDITTDLNGPTVHRLQVVIWTVTLGVVFLIGVYRNLAMPEFSATLLALMGISGAGYVGFKYPEVNN